jgi:hypothetical protein
MASLRARLVTPLALVALLTAGAVARRDDATAFSKEQIQQFLLTAKIVKHKDLSKGVTRPIKLTLTDGVVTHDAVFSAVNEKVPVMKFKSGRTELDFVDSYAYNIAAYRMAELIGLDNMMPVTVERQYERQKGSLAWWVDHKMDEEERLKQGLLAPDRAEWDRQMYRMRLFAHLVADTDRNAGNILIDGDWKIWMIDFTRAFRHARELNSTADLQKCDRRLLTRLRELTPEMVAAATKPYIGPGEVDALIARRDAIVALFDKLVAERGEERVLY